MSTKNVFSWRNKKNIFLHKNICCGYSLEAPCRGTSNEYQQHMFSWRNKKNIFLHKNLYCGYSLEAPGLSLWSNKNYISTFWLKNAPYLSYGDAL